MRWCGNDVYNHQCWNSCFTMPSTPYAEASVPALQAVLAPLLPRLSAGVMAKVLDELHRHFHPADVQRMRAQIRDILRQQLFADTVTASSSSSNSQQAQRPARILLDVPTGVLALVCGFLPVRTTVCSVDVTCRAVHDQLSAACLTQAHLSLRGRAVHSLLHSSPRSLALLSSLSSLSVELKESDLFPGEPSLTTRLFALRSPARPSLFVCPALTSLAVQWSGETPRGGGGGLPDATVDRLSCFMSLLRSSPSSFTSLRRLHVSEYVRRSRTSTSFTELSALQELTHLRMNHLALSAPSVTSLVSALSSLPHLEFLDLRHCKIGYGPFTAAVRASPLPRGLRALVLPAQERDAFLRQPAAVPLQLAAEVESLLDALNPAGAAEPSCDLEQLVLPTQYIEASGAILASMLSLPRLRVLHACSHPFARRERFAAFCLQCEVAPRLPPLVQLGLPVVSAPDVATVTRVLPSLLERLTQLRHLTLQCGEIAGTTVLSLLPSSTMRSLNRLELTKLFGADAMPASGVLLLPRLTELVIDGDRWSDDSLNALLAACPALLRLSLTGVRMDSWAVVSTAGRCCPGLLSLFVAGWTDLPSPAAAEAAQVSGGQQLALGSPFLPQLISLHLDDWGRSHLSCPPYDFSDLLRFTQPPASALRTVSLGGRALTAQLVASLSCLPSLCYLNVNGDGGVAEALRRTRTRLERDGLTELIDAHEPWPPELDNNLCPEPLGPEQHQLMRQRVLRPVPYERVLYTEDSSSVTSAKFACSVELLLQEMASQTCLK